MNILRYQTELSWVKESGQSRTITGSTSASGSFFIDIPLPTLPLPDFSTKSVLREREREGGRGGETLHFLRLQERVSPSSFPPVSLCVDGAAAA